MVEIRLTPESLATVGVSILNKYRVRLRCQNCGRVWMPVPCPEVRLPDGWWICPSGCNKHLGPRGPSGAREGAHPTPGAKL